MTICDKLPAMLIALDYDETYTVDPAFWAAVVDVGRKFGHKFVCITARCRSLEDEAELRAALPVDVELHFSCTEPKEKYAKRHGLAVDVWIDDMPGWIVGVT